MRLGDLISSISNNLALRTLYIKPLKIWVLCLVIATILLLVWHSYGMNKEIRIDSNVPLQKSVYADNELGGGSTGTIVRQGNELVLNCKYSDAYKYPYCGFILGPGPENINFDLSGYDKVAINLETSNSQNPIRIFIHSFDDDFSSPDKFNSLRVHELHYNPKLEHHPFVTELSKFQVAMWWVNEFQIPPDKIKSDFSNVVAFSFGLNEEEHETDIQVNFRSLTFSGKWISYARLQLLIIALWAGSAAIYLLFSFSITRKAVEKIHAQKKALQEINKVLEIERQELETLATRDALTGIYNRLGLRSHLHAETSLVKLKKKSLSLLFVDIDRFYLVNERYGSEMGEEILVHFCALIEECTRTEDIFCRWSDDEFLLLCKDTSVQSATIVANKISKRVDERSWPLGIKVSCSIGIAEMNPEESIGNFIKRADDALAQAKNQGIKQIRADYGLETKI